MVGQASLPVIETRAQLALAYMLSSSLLGSDPLPTPSCFALIGGAKNARPSRRARRPAPF